MKYLRIKNSLVFTNNLYLFNPNHEGLRVSEFNKWIKEKKGIMNVENFKRLSFNEKLSCGDLFIQHSNYVTTYNDILVDVVHEKLINLSFDFYKKFCIDIFDIIPEIKKIYKLFGRKDFDLDDLYDEWLLDFNKQLPGFTNEEWEKFVETNIEQEGLVWTEDV